MRNLLLILLGVFVLSCSQVQVKQQSPLDKLSELDPYDRYVEAVKMKYDLAYKWKSGEVSEEEYTIFDSLVYDVKRKALREVTPKERRDLEDVDMKIFATHPVRELLRSESE